MAETEKPMVQQKPKNAPGANAVPLASSIPEPIVEPRPDPEIEESNSKEDSAEPESTPRPESEPQKKTLDASRDIGEFLMQIAEYIGGENLLKILFNRLLATLDDKLFKNTAVNGQETQSPKEEKPADTLLSAEAGNVAAKNIVKAENIEAENIEAEKVEALPLQPMPDTANLEQTHHLEMEEIVLHEQREQPKEDENLSTQPKF